jgi:photosystem II stability/assembly factor-like uncharacterized protein
MREGALKYSMRKTLVVLLSIWCFVPGLLAAQQKISEDLFSATFTDEKEGWACGRSGSIIHTSDGGKTWVRQNSGVNFTLTSIHFVDTQNGWAVGDEGTIIRTSDGGKAWEKQKSPVPFYHMKVFFMTPLKGWIATEKTHILYTQDGGKTWSIQFKDEDYIFKGISFCDPLHGWAVGEYGHIYHTKNGGAEWKKQAGKFEISKENGDIEAGTFLFDVVALDPQTAWAVGIDGYVTKTVDGGRTWKEVAVGASKTQFFFIGSDKKDTLLIGGKGTFVLSTDKGKTWQLPKFNPSVKYGWIYDVAMRGSSGFVAVGWNGAIYLSSGDKASTSWDRVYNK